MGADIKPENILLCEGTPWGADFEVARALQAAGSDQLTQTGMSVGTPAYVSPEQRLADPIIDGGSDLYTLGHVLYEMLAGEVPYTGTSAQAIVAGAILEPDRVAATWRNGDWAIGVGPRTDLAAKPMIGVTVRPLTSRQ